MTEEEFIDILEAFNADGAELTWESNPELSLEYEEGEVIRTDPPYTGDPIPFNSHIIIYVSSGSFSSRWLALAFHEAALQPVGVPVFYVFLDFEDDPVYLNHSNVTFSWDGHDWQGMGDIGFIEFPDETPDLTAQPLRLGLSGVNPTLLAEAGEAEYKGREVVVYVAMHHPETLALLGEPEEFWRGFMDVMTREADQGVANIILTCEHWFRIAPAVTRYTDEDQQTLFAGDRFFDQLKTVGDPGKWGGKDLRHAPAGGGGGPKGNPGRDHP